MKPTIIYIDAEKHLPEIAHMPISNVVKSLLAEKFEYKKMDLIARFIVQSGYHFAPDELSDLRIPLGSRYSQLSTNHTFAHLFADRSYVFSLSELLILENHAESYYNQTIAHFMVQAGHSFTLDELLQLGNPADRDKISVAHQMVRNGHIFTALELAALGNPVDFRGDTLAFDMAIMGHRFSPSDLDTLGNPINKNGKTLEDVWNEGEQSRKERSAREKLIRRLVFTNGDPAFELDYFLWGANKYTRKCSKQMVVEFQWFAWEQDTNLHTYNAFKLIIQPSESGWSIQMEDYEHHDTFNYLYRKVAVSQLVDELNDALSNHQDFDLTNAHELLQNLDTDWHLSVDMWPVI